MIKLPALDFLKSFDRKFLIDLGIRYGLLLFFLTLGLIPSCGRLQFLKGQVHQKKSQLQTTRLKLSEAQKAQSNRQTIMSQILTQEDRFFTENDLSQMLSMVSELAKQNNLQMIASKPLKDNEKAGLQAPPPPPIKPPPAPGQPQIAMPQTQAPPPYNNQEFEIDLTGGYHALGKFLNDSRAYSKFLYVKRLSILGAAKSKTEHEIKLTLTVYLKPQEAP